MTSIRKYKLELYKHRNPKTLKDYISYYQSFQGIEKLHKEGTENSVKCSCGHSVFIPAYKDKEICNWCKRTVFNKTKNHFKYKIRKMKEGK